MEYEHEPNELKHVCNFLGKITHYELNYKVNGSWCGYLISNSYSELINGMERDRRLTPGARQKEYVIREVNSTIIFYHPADKPETEAKRGKK